MDQPPSEAQIPISPSDIFAIVQQLASQLQGSRMQQVFDTARGLDIKDGQLLVNLLATVLEKNYHLLRNADRALDLLTKVAAPTSIIAYHRILSSQHFNSENNLSPDAYTIQDDRPVTLKVVRRGKKNNSGDYTESLVKWVHLSHLNVLPLYGALLEGESGPVSLITLSTTDENIATHAKKLPQASRMPLVLDVVNGLCYLHQLRVVHGGLNPQNVLISDDGRALIAGLDGEAYESLTARYSAPELLEEEVQPTKASDIWSLACLCYEVLSGNIPFCQLRQEAKVGGAVAKGKKPTRPGYDGVSGDDISDAIWRPVSACWELEPKDRPRCVEVLNAFTGTDIRDDRPAAKPFVRPEMLEHTDTPAIDLEHAKSLLTRILGSDQSLPPPSQIPEQLRNPLSGLVENRVKAEAAAAATKKFNPVDTQTLVDALDLLWEELPPPPNINDPVNTLLTSIMASTHIFPQRFRLPRIRYDTTPVTEDNVIQVYKASGLNAYVNVVTDSNKISRLFDFMAPWAHSSHSNVVPFYGAFDDSANDVPRFCFLSSSEIKGTLRWYAPQHPQKSRMPLVLDVTNGLAYLHEIDIVHNDISGESILITHEGRSVISAFNTTSIISVSPKEQANLPNEGYMYRFESPELVKLGASQTTVLSDVWSLGSLFYEVLSRKVPYYQYKGQTDIQAAVSRGELPKRPSSTDEDVDLIDDQLWDLILGCCKVDTSDRLTTADIKELLTNMDIQDDRTEAQNLPGPDIMTLRLRPEIDWDRVEQLLGQIQVELLRNPLSKVVQNRTKEVATAVAELQRDDVQTIVDFLDVALKDHLTIIDERNRVLALLSRVMTQTQVLPRRHELKGIKYVPRPIAEGGFGKVHRGLSDPTICVKVTTRVNDPRALVAYIKELILWAHSSHQNVLPFYGVFFDDSQQICLVSPYMTKGNLSNYARQLPQKSRVPLLLDTIKGLDYLHGLGVVHTDLKGENVLISDEGRGLITDFGASHVITATAKGGATKASVASTLRYTAPEIVQDETRSVRPSKECDVWSYGCLFYEVLSRKLPYYEYQLDAQVLAALFRGQLPKRPGLVRGDNDDSGDDDDWDEVDTKDWDDLDETSWALIMKCLVTKPEDRPSASRIQELIVDMKVWDSRPPAKGLPGAEILKQKPNVQVDLDRAGALLNHLQVMSLVQSVYKYSDQDIAAAVAKLDSDDGDYLSNFWALTLARHINLLNDGGRLLGIYTSVVVSRQLFPPGYILKQRPRYSRKVIGEGSFGKVFRGSELDICLKASDYQLMDPGSQGQWDKALVPWAHASHPNILPFRGVFFKGPDYLVSPFLANGNLGKYSSGLPQRLRILPISDAVEGLRYLHKIGIIHGNLKTQNILISDEGRGLVTDFRPYHVNTAAAADGPTGPFITSTLRFTAPELVKDSQMLPTTSSDVWSIGCLLYEVLSRKVPYYDYMQDSQIRAALSQGELPVRPVSTNGDTDEIDDEYWDFIMQCCASEPESRPELANIQQWLQDRSPEDTRPVMKPLPGAELQKHRWQYTVVDVIRVGEILDKIKVQFPKDMQEEKDEKDDEKQG